MKKTIINALVVQLAVVFAVSCTKTEIQSEIKPGLDGNVKTVIEMNPSLEKVKTYIDENRADPTIMWGTGEYITMWLNDGEEDIFAQSLETTADLNNGKEKGHFTFEIKIGQSDNFKYGGFYPSSAATGTLSGSSVTLTLPSEQHPKAGSYDPKAFIMTADPESSSAVPNPWNAQLYRAVALNKLTIGGITGNVESVTITAPEGQILAGGRVMDLSKKLSEEESASYSDDKTNVITVVYDTPVDVTPGGSIDVFFTSWGMSIANGEVLRIRVKTSENVLYNGGLQAGTAGLKFKENYFNKFTGIDFSGVTQRPADVIEFMEAYANQLRVWEETVGNVSGLHALETSGHIIPQNSEFLVSGTTYTKAAAFYVAAKLYQSIMNGTEITSTSGITLETVPTTCNWPSAPYYEKDDNGKCLLVSANSEFISNQIGRQLTWFNSRQSDNPSAGYFANYCGQSGNPNGYKDIGYTSVERLNLLLIRVFDYILKNKVYSNVSSQINGLLFDADLYYHTDQKKNIKAFASKYISVLDEWNRNTGRLNLTAPYKDQPYTGDGGQFVVDEGHFVPYNYTIDVLGTTYTTSNMFELALRSFLLVCGYDGENKTEVGANKIPPLSTVGGGGLITSLPNESNYENYHWKEEGGFYAAEPSNGGYLSNVNNGSTEDKTKVKKDILLNFAMRNVNYPFNDGKGTISNMSRYVESQLVGYKGIFSSARALTTYATFFKYLLDNNLGAASDTSLDSVQFDSDLY